MKYLISFSLILIYLTGSFQSSWILLDFYWNRDDYTQKYCQFLDQGITQCRASCYLEDKLSEKENPSNGDKIVSSQKVKVVELGSEEEIGTSSPLEILKPGKIYSTGNYHFDFYSSIFHPPKA